MTEMDASRWRGTVAEPTSGLGRGLRAGLPLAIAGLADGLLFGALARQAGLSAAEATLMSGLVYAGTAQFLAVGLWASPLPIGTILLTTLGVNLRYLLMGATLRPWLDLIPARLRYPFLHFLSDESWALATHESSRGRLRPSFLVGSGLVLFSGWIVPTFIGATAGNAIRNPARLGLDFAYVAILAALLVGLRPGRRQVLPWVVAGGTAVVAQHVLPTGWYILAGGITGSLAGMVRREA